MTGPNRNPVQVVKHEIPGTGVFLDRVSELEHPFIPQIDPNYAFRKDLVQEVAYCLETGTNCMLVGDAGAGKSSMVEQLAAQLNRPLRRVNLNGESDTSVLEGRDYTVRDAQGNNVLKFVPGPLAVAVQNGYWFLCDEIDAALQPVLFLLQQLLEDDGKLVLSDTEGTIIQRHAAFRFFATANTVGVAGRNRLLYSGTMQRMNEATLDRFGVLVNVGYMEPALEEQVIRAKVPALDADFVKAIVKIANDTRKNLQDDRLSCTFSTRRCIHWARAMTRFHPVRAAKLTVLNKLNQDDFKVLLGVIERYFGTA